MNNPETTPPMLADNIEPEPEVDVIAEAAAEVAALESKVDAIEAKIADAEAGLDNPDADRREVTISMETVVEEFVRATVKDLDKLADMSDDSMIGGFEKAYADTKKAVRKLRPELAHRAGLATVASLARMISRG